MNKKYQKFMLLLFLLNFTIQPVQAQYWDYVKNTFLHNWAFIGFCVVSFYAYRLIGLHKSEKTKLSKLNSELAKKNSDLENENKTLAVIAKKKILNVCNRCDLFLIEYYGSDDIKYIKNNNSLTNLLNSFFDPNQGVPDYNTINDKSGGSTGKKKQVDFMSDAHQKITLLLKFEQIIDYVVCKLNILDTKDNRVKKIESIIFEHYWPDCDGAGGDLMLRYNEDNFMRRWYSQEYCLKISNKIDTIDKDKIVESYKIRLLSPEQKIDCILTEYNISGEENTFWKSFKELLQSINFFDGAKNDSKDVKYDSIKDFNTEVKFKLLSESDQNILKKNFQLGSMYNALGRIRKLSESEIVSLNINQIIENIPNYTANKEKLLKLETALQN